MKRLLCLAALFATITLSHATIFVGPWTAIFQGVDHAVGTNFPSTTFTNNGVVLTDSTRQVVHCVRVDLTDPGVQLFTTPRAPNYVAESRETLSLSISNFIRSYGLQVAADANFYSVNPGGSDPVSEGLPGNVDGMLVCTGRVVSASDGARFASLLFSTNNVPTFNLNNRPPATNAPGIYTAVTGYYPVLTNGVSVWALYYNDFNNLYSPGDSYIHGVQPRTAFGISQDKRYLFLITIDGRQSGYSDGAIDVETAMWMLEFGAWDALNMDGGGSTAMYMADCAGNPVRLNHSSYIPGYGRERILGDHFGVYAQPLPTFINNIESVPGQTTANITWTTVSPASSQVEYGLTANYGTLSTNDPTAVTDHSLTLSGLTPATRYFYRVLSSDGATEYKSACGQPFRTTNDATVGMVFDLTKDWKYNTPNLDGINWQAASYNDAGWTGHGPGLLWADSRGPNAGVPFENTQMPINPVTTYPFITYYFRTHFTYTNSLAGVTLTFSNYIDDGSAFYLNGIEINRDFLVPGAANAATATGYNCPDANCPYIFTNSGANLHSGDNVLAVEVHNFNPNSPDVTFGSALLYSVPAAVPPPPPFITNVVVNPGETTATITWTTLSNATSRIRYGLTTSLSSFTPLDSTPATNHSVTLTGLAQLTNYYFRIFSFVGTTPYTNDGTFSTVPFYIDFVSATNTWAYTTNNEDGVNWQARTYDESLFDGAGPALLYIETNPAVFPLNTPLPATPAGLPYPTYYFRTHFVFDTNLAGFSLVFTNYIDDGAVFYLNGAEIQRVRMPAAPQAISYTDLAASCPPTPSCDAEASAPDIFRISGSLLTNLVAGADNVLAAEVHQHSANSSDIVFGSAVGLVRALVSETQLRVGNSGNVATISWDGAGFTLQQTHDWAGTNSWTDVPGPVKASPYAVTNPPTSTFYRLRN